MPRKRAKWLLRSFQRRITETSLDKAILDKEWCGETVMLERHITPEYQP